VNAERLMRSTKSGEIGSKCQTRNTSPVLSDAPRKAPIVPGYEQSLFRFSYSQRIDEEIWRRIHEREGTIQLLIDIINVRRNAIVLSFSYTDVGTGRNSYSSAMILDRVAFADRIVRVKD
jgi:hypothetical protein